MKKHKQHIDQLWYIFREYSEMQDKNNYINFIDDKLPNKLLLILWAGSGHILRNDLMKYEET